MAVALSSSFSNLRSPQLLIAIVPKIKMSYCISQDLNNSNLYIDGKDGRKYKIYKRTSGFDKADVRSLVVSTIYKGAGWLEWLNWYYSCEIEKILENLMFTNAFGNIILNGEFCNKKCYKDENLRLSSDEIEELNFKDCVEMIEWYFNDLKHHISIEFIKQSMNHYKIFTYLPSKGFKIKNQNALFLMMTEHNVDKFDILDGDELIIDQEFKCNVCIYLRIV